MGSQITKSQRIGIYDVQFVVTLGIVVTLNTLMPFSLLA